MHNSNTPATVPDDKVFGPNMEIVNAYIALYKVHLNACNRPLRNDKMVRYMAGILWDIASHAERLLIIKGTA